VCADVSVAMKRRKSERIKPIARGKIHFLSVD
jgi:hypothetical protein